jgi:molybdopterin molybdotransferase
MADESSKQRLDASKSLLPLEEARRLVLEAVAARGGGVASRVDLAEADGLLLAKAVRADRDLPPFDRATLDGYAVVAGDPALGSEASLPVIETVCAGAMPVLRVARGRAALVMTGAPVPAGADAVIRREDAILSANGSLVRLPAAKSGAGVHVRGSDSRRGATVLVPGTRITPRVTAVLASVGCVRPTVLRRPRVAVLVTGDEIRPAEERRLPAAAIRNSNGPALDALVRAAGGVVRTSLTAPDQGAALARAVRAALRGADVVLISGGVSAGDHDLVPPTLRRCGVKEVFHGLDLRPGKPAWFGRKGATLVFGLPGNPVSTQVVFALLVAPALEALRGEPSPGPKVRDAVLDAAVPASGKRAAWLPALAARGRDGSLRVRLSPWNGSGDFVGFAGCDALLHRPAGSAAAKRGAVASVILLSPD